MSEVDKSAELLHKLSYHKQMASNLLDVPCPNRSVKVAALQAQIGALEKLVLELPSDDESGLFEEWRDSILDLYRRLFAFASGRKMKPVAKVAKPKGVSTQESATSEEVETACKETSTGDGKQSNDERPPRRGRPAKAQRGGSSSDDAEPVEKKEKIRAIIEGLFKKLEPVADIEKVIKADSTLEPFRRFALRVNRAIRMVSRFEEDAEFLSTVLGYVFPKAPPAVLKRFNSLNGAEADKEENGGDQKGRPPVKGLRLLKQCLIAELTAFYEAMRQSAASPNDVTDEGSDEGALAACFFCKSTEHGKYACPEVSLLRFLFLFPNLTTFSLFPPS